MQKPSFKYNTSKQLKTFEQGQFKCSYSSSVFFFRTGILMHELYKCLIQLSYFIYLVVFMYTQINRKWPICNISKSNELHNMALPSSYSIQDNAMYVSPLTPDCKAFIFFYKSHFLWIWFMQYAFCVEIWTLLIYMYCFRLAANLWLLLWMED